MYKLLFFFLFLSIVSHGSPCSAQRVINGEWLHEIKTDPMDDTTSCIVKKNSSLPIAWFFFHNKQGLSISIVGDEYPGEDETFRIDSNPAVAEEEGLSGAKAQKILSQIKGGGKKLLVKFIEWPSGAPVFLEYDLTGVLEHLDACKAATKKGK